jgi:2,4-dienoyl-CoA reductase-like NADH-dependent reductase (Old Yellow Enzyme family)
MAAPADILARPLDLPTERLANRLAKAAMTEGLAGAAGVPGDGLVLLYETWAKGGAGLLVTGNVIVDRQHLERPGNVVIAGEPDQAMRAGLKRWAQAARSHGAGLWMQLGHAGRQTPAIVNPTPKAPSAIPLALPGKNFGVPIALTDEEIRTLITRFATAAAAAEEAGFSGVEIHAAHGYLISSFLSPRANRRDDSWGGALENRARFLMEIVAAVRGVVGPRFTIAVKLNSADFQKGGFAAAESIDVAKRLAAAGVHVLEISGGTYEQPRMTAMEGLEKPDFTGMPASTAAREAYFLDFAVEMRRAANLALMVTGGFRTAAAMARAVDEDGIALVGLARPLVVEPDGPAKLLAGAAALNRHEDALRIGPGLLGPRSPFKTVRALNGFGALYWQYQQLRRLGRGEAIDERLSLLAALAAEQRAQSQDRA